MEIIGNWRASHNYPLNTFQTTLRRKARKIDANCVVAQRIKRLSSIYHKLDRFKSMQLSQMQDIGGCRAIVDSSLHALQLAETYKKSDLRHKLYRETNYILEPRKSGYRGIHLLYQYVSDKSKTEYNGLRIEMQIRSSLQHAWATAVETVGTLTSNALKSSLGDADWLRFFALMGSVIALEEGCVLVPETPMEKTRLIDELRYHSNKLNASRSLRGFGQALNTLEQPSAQMKNAHFFLLQLNPVKGEAKITGFTANDSERANAEYLAVEREIEEAKSGEKADTTIAVLVSVDNLAALKRAYPNYFLDTHVFAGLLDKALED